MGSSHGSAPSSSASSAEDPHRCSFGLLYLGTAVRYPKGLRTDEEREENLKAHHIFTDRSY